MSLEAPQPAPSRARFLFRQEHGCIDAATWRLHAGWIAAVAVALTVGWLLLRPYAQHDLKTEAFIRWVTVTAFTYVILYAFALILLAICYTMLSIKRLRDVRRPTALAGLVPLFVFFDASLHFLRAQTPDVIVLPYVIALDVVLAVIVVWTVAELGFRQGR